MAFLQRNGWNIHLDHVVADEPVAEGLNAGQRSRSPVPGSAQMTFERVAAS